MSHPIWNCNFLNSRPLWNKLEQQVGAIIGLYLHKFQKNPYILRSVVHFDMARIIFNHSSFSQARTWRRAVLHQENFVGPPSISTVS